MSQHFKEMMYLNLLKDKAYTSKVLNYLDKNKSIGFAMPSMVHIGHPTLGHAWFTNRELAIKIAEKVGVKIHLMTFLHLLHTVLCFGSDQRHCVNFLNITGSLKSLIKSQCIVMDRWRMF